MNDKPSIDVQRRRKANKPTGRAEAPQRPSRPSGGSSSGGGSYSPTGGIPNISRGGKLGGCGGVILVIVVIAFYLLSGGGGGDILDTPPVDNLPENEGPIAQNLPTSTPRPTRPVTAGETGQNWLVMLYQDADDQILEQDIFVDLNEAEKIGSTDRVTIVSQLDRFQGGFENDGGWSSTRRYLVTQDDDLNAIHSQLVDEPGELNMADGGTLVDFVTWAVENYPADRHVLIMSDHGMGWPGGWSDPQPGGRDPGSAPLVSALSEDFIYLSELDGALTEIRQAAGLQKFDIIGLDACLMSQLETYAALQEHALYAVASEETEPGLGWAYAGFLEKLVENPDISSESLAAEIVNTYLTEDQRVVDDQARAEFLRQGSPLGGFFGISSVSAEQLADQLSRSSTLTAVDLSEIPALMTAYNNFAYTLQDEDQAVIAAARGRAQSYTSVFGKNTPPSYIDLGNFVQLMENQTGNSTIQQAAGGVLDALSQAVITEMHGPAKAGSTGIAIYFPNSTMYRSPYTGPQSYNLIAERFVQASLWDDFLGYHYSDRTFRPDTTEAVAPQEVTRAPGSGDITVTNVIASESTAGPDSPVRISADISGENIGYLYLFIGLYDQGSNSIYVADTDFLESPDTQETGGVYYPVWPDSEEFTINFEWDASLFSISDGTSSVLALFNPVTYGAAAENAVYTVDGTYTFVDTGEQRYAQMHFIEGRLAQVFGFQGTDDLGSPWEITPSAGDTFTLQQKWMELDSSGKISEIVYEAGETLTFEETSAFTWEAVFAPAGEYLVGFLAQDLDGNMSQGYTQVTVR